MKFLYWAPRVFGIFGIAFLGIFALDVFGEYVFPEVLVALFMHLIPNFVLVAILILAWKRELIGGLVFIALGLAFVIMTLGRDMFWSSLIVAAFPILTGALFILHTRLKIRSKK